MSRTKRKHWNWKEEVNDGFFNKSYPKSFYYTKRKEDKQELYKGDIYEHYSIYYDGLEEFEEEMNVCDYCGCLIYGEACPC